MLTARRTAGLAASMVLAATLLLRGDALMTSPTTKAATITFDFAAAPDMADFVARAQRDSDLWYPKIAQLLASDGYVAPDSVQVVFDPKYDGVAECSGTRIVCSTKWFTAHPDDVGAVIHELAHVVQRYTDGDRPGWLVEGIADYVRWFNYEPESKRPKPDAEKANYDDSYRTSAHFLDWAQRTHDPQLVSFLNAACREARYEEGLWKARTGKTLEELGAEWKASLKKK